MKIKRDALIGHVKEQAERALLAKVLDNVELVLRHHRTALTNFYDPYHTGLIISMLERIPDLDFATGGGYPAAERVRVAIFPDYLDASDINFDLMLLAVEGNFKMVKVTHRDFLGSILGLGIKREMIGDVIVTEKGCQVVAAREVASYLMTNLTKVHRVGVAVREIAPEEWQMPEVTVKEIKSTVASLRLDAVAAVGFGTSRTRIAREITAERLNLNWHPCSDVSAPVKPGDILSIRGRGRVEVAEVKENTKSGRIGIVIKRFL
ncbi:RNA-binding S4 domain protein [Desulfotomaculum nigrificans CO-1-SRB]|uniref:RNA-binding S4 domain protein n=1 Tax=Desulfotomaculum nigrificans (strain DSM 14880 / VKM B-2319 / CO-1-SRB) TaxID=868595 RepID=F6B394_DESCC|nr:YlmH/Sll1252 family protein [Desulfotomaculum nigrificans]AEF95125.1 RNA-binding S4 domain protein [Desulfotomaculum nigrificans CO-1-SRB]